LDSSLRDLTHHNFLNDSGCQGWKQCELGNASDHEYAIDRVPYNRSPDFACARQSIRLLIGTGLSSVKRVLHVIAEPLHFEDVRSYLIEGNDRAILFDTGMGVGDIKTVVDELTMLPISVLNSHAHWDHIGGNWRFDQIMIHGAEADDLSRTRSLADKFPDNLLFGRLPTGIERKHLEVKASHATTLLSGGERIDLGGRILEIMHTPGHSPGGIVAVDHNNGIIFTTDVAYLAPLYAYAPTTNLVDYRRSLLEMERIASRMRVAYPSHNQTPFDPAKIKQMRLAFDSILEGRRPDGVDETIARHVFGEFSVLVPASFSATGAVA
jgi:glyoxylase-like metal-dependent hydrolase (beta-lactamase superfamily II)